MKLSEYIKQLQEIEKSYGSDIEVNHDGNEIYLEIEGIQCKDSWLVDWISWD